MGPHGETLTGAGNCRGGRGQQQGQWGLGEEAGREGGREGGDRGSSNGERDVCERMRGENWWVAEMEGES